ncbi:MAG: helix-hairpin-helix domain-containing protein [Clostridia bacterium]|nr:helix-hairpin-helix domain-containing protein [Clostridia bacterium]
MAKLLNVEQKEQTKRILIKGIILFFALVAVITAAFIHHHSEKVEKSERTEEVKLCVHVKGAVEKSGVYYVPYGTRVLDLDSVAGGFLASADLDGINLAAYLKDGQEVYIPYKGSKETGAYNLNTVSVEELVENVEGIGETYANKIVSYREGKGRFNSVNELKTILSESTYEKVREKFYVE